ncbi:NADH-quinone oxidoreductase subunit H [Akkermansiaceae bacterium]|nr:NADH-quinone oxidoreductase subunit H [Akkermansiaceae bacterium]MDB4369702.1 NADH-quinone oxidoreductase subunit H [Akkermansiaceae bacterium]MDB4382905.1 NADH-quinone oxidoreductase subunit H [Akkermansiaceae bacterium]MDB4488825.1 NADH-quinone oxidoreductase subunit H [Akkermansiaceae bacterium]MDB4509417.1 NADH-quinone oxidoreductase subunit H [Akkermansiaceae bacterium]
MDTTLLIAAAIKIAVFIGITMSFVSICVIFERRFSAIIQDRVGPNRTMLPLSILGFKKDLALPIGGLTQPIADGLKFILKEDFTPSYVRKFFFWLAPALVVVPALLTMAVIPFGSPMEIAGDIIPMAVADLNVGPLYIFAIASLSVYGITLAGWASNSKYPFFGGVRACAQMISYEIALGLSIVPVIMFFGGLNLGHIVEEQVKNGWLLLPLWGGGLSVERWLMLIPLGISFIIFTTSIFAETNRMPFDLPECETELVGGYHTEYSSMKFALFFMGEYAAMVVGSALIVTLFLGGWSIGFGVDNLLPAGAWWVSLLHIGVFLGKVTFFILFFILVRWTVPRFRYDQLMNLGWIVFFEAALINVFLAALVIAYPSIGFIGVTIGFALLITATILLIIIAKGATKKPSATAV